MDKKTIKMCTDLPQSKKLAEFLPLESADMYWWYSGKRYYIEAIDDGDFNEKGDIRAWSLAALLDVLPDYTLQTNIDGTVFVVCDSKKPMISDVYDNPVDACYEMIIKLHELKML